MSRARMAGHRLAGVGELRHRLRHELRVAQVRDSRAGRGSGTARSGRAARACGYTSVGVEVERAHQELLDLGRARRPRSPAGPRAPRRRLRTSSSIVLSRSSTSSSSISYSLSRVTRKTVAWSSSMPGNRSGRCRRMTVSSGDEDVRPFVAPAAARTAAARPAPARRRTACPASPRPLQQHGEVERLVQQVRERVARVDGQRRQHREDLAAEHVAQVLAVGRRSGPWRRG